MSPHHIIHTSDINNVGIEQIMMKQLHMDSATAFINQARALLSGPDYKQFLYLIVTVHAGSITPFAFREKIKYLFRNHPEIVTQLNAFLPQEFKFSCQEIQELEEPRDYKYLEKYEAGIRFFTDFKNVLLEESPVLSRKAALAADGRALREFKKFQDLIKSHNREEIDAEEVYRRAYKKLDDHFDLTNQFDAIIHGQDATSPSYVTLPAQEGVSSSSSSSSSEPMSLLNNRSIINKSMGRCQNVGNKAVYLLHNVDEVIGSNLESKPSLECKARTDAERKKKASFWWEEKKFELHVLLARLTLAEKKFDKALNKYMIKRGEMKEASALREYLLEKRVKVMMVEKIFGKLEDLMSAPEENLARVLDVLREKMVKVKNAIKEFDEKYKSQLQFYPT